MSGSAARRASRSDPRLLGAGLPAEVGRLDHLEDEVLLSLLTPVCISNELLYEIRVNMRGGQLLEKGGFSSPVRAGYGNQPALLLMQLVVCLVEDFPER
jgi:hypothetical protein